MRRRILIANRGDIAIRVARACRDLGYEPIAVFSDADADAEHVRAADEALRIGEGPASTSYLDQDAVLSAAIAAGADAIHPGFGFLSENADFAARVEGAGIRWCGPSAEVIRAAGDKAAARSTAIAAGVPVVPGTGVLATVEQAREAAQQLGFPVLVKAAAGGGGKGIRRADNAEELAEAFAQASKEVAGAFGDASLYLEKALDRVRHIEVQILGDAAGNIVHLYERNCSLQRRRQKIIEEAPAPGLDSVLREQICASAVRLARALGYVSAGTAEFLLDESGRFYFIELNARVQVEHGITELITGVDIVAEQLRIAFGEALSVRQDDIVVRGAAIEVRVNAENPDFHFLGSPGPISQCVLPAGPGIRVDSGVLAGSVVQPYYDSMLMKVMAVGVDRGQALARLKRAMGELRVEGVVTTSGFVRGVLERDWFGAADYDTATIEAELALRVQGTNR